MILSEELELIRKSAEQLVQRVISPNAKQWNEEHQYPQEALSLLGQSGFMGMLVPEQYDGSEVGFLAYVLALIEIAKGDGGTSTIVSVQNSVVNMPILNFGTTAHKDRYLKPLARGEMIGAFCLTEPEAGSDAASIRTKASKVQGGYQLNGTKQFITSGSHAGLALVFAKIAPYEDSSSITAFLVPTESKGFEAVRQEHKMGQHSAEVSQIVLSDCFVPEENRLGEEGQGYKIALSNLESGRLGIGAQSVGMAEAAFELALTYAQQRVAFGKSLVKMPTISQNLADMATQLQAAKALLFQAAQLKDAQQPCLKEAAMAKLFASETAISICDKALQIHGGYGYLKDFTIERIYRDVRVTSIYEGTSDIQRFIIARELNKGH